MTCVSISTASLLQAALVSGYPTAALRARDTPKLRLFCSVLRLCRVLLVSMAALGRFAPTSLMQTLSWLISSASCPLKFAVNDGRQQGHFFVLFAFSRLF